MSITPPTEADVTRLLHELAGDDPDALNRLARAVYEPLRRVAANAMRREDAGHTLQTTVLVHEAFLRLTREQQGSWHSRSQFYRLAAQVIRRVLVDHARRRQALKRQAPAAWELEQAAAGPDDDRLPLLDAALHALAAEDTRAAQVVELRYFGGLSMEAAAEALGISTSTAKRDWRFAQAFLRQQLAQSRD